ncbi:MAG: nodulation S family protein [Salinibacterium sp.]|nr:nodulation S family protein [Salinibacterium sp.]
MTMRTEYFDELYAANDDPWSFTTRWYERRKRSLTIAALPHPRYERAFEIGCSIGNLTAELADRCGSLLAVDAAAAAIATARSRLASVTNVELAVMRVPAEWPAGTFDLIVMSEIAYYFDESDLVALLGVAVDSLSPDGVLVACHWRHPVAHHPLNGDSVHQLIRTSTTLVSVAEYADADLRLEVFSVAAAQSVAQREGLV